MATIEVAAPAKVNLTLRVTGRRPDGYHLLDSVVVFAADVADTVRVRPSKEISLSIGGPMAEGVPPGDDNLVLRAARFLQGRAGVAAGAEIALVKHLPHGAGIGGGSADAAATLKALARLWNVPLPPPEEVAALGADVPACLAGPAPLRMQGIGERIAPLPPLPEGWLLLANPGTVLPTAAVFAARAALGGAFAAEEAAWPRPGALSELAELAVAAGNALFAPAVSLAPEVGELTARLRRLPGALAANMSGSGTTCWALFPTQATAEAAANALRAEAPDLWVRVSRIAS